MPRSRSISIQSDVASRCLPARALTAPASSIAPAYSSSFSVRVVLPASGCEMIANVRLGVLTEAESPVGGGWPPGQTIMVSAVTLEREFGSRPSSVSMPA